MKTITKETMCHMLYCLNWHIKDMWAAYYGGELNDDERTALREQITELRALKEKVIAKLITEGYAAIRGVQKNLHRKPPRKYYSIRLTRGFSFHLPMKEFKEFMNEYEKAGHSASAEGAQDGDI